MKELRNISKFNKAMEWQQCAMLSKCARKYKRDFKIVRNSIEGR